MSAHIDTRKEDEILVNRLNLYHKEHDVADGVGIPDGIGLLFSILVRYPELYSVVYQQAEHAIVFRFTVHGLDRDILETRIKEALEVFHEIEGHTMRLCQIELKEAGKVMLLAITRDLESLGKREVGLLVDLVRDMSQKIIFEDERLTEDEQDFQDEIIGHILQSIHNCRLEKGLVAIREDGKILVYNNKN